MREVAVVVRREGGRGKERARLKRWITVWSWARTWRRVRRWGRAVGSYRDEGLGGCDWS